MLSNNNSNNSTISSGGGFSNLRNICNFLPVSNAATATMPGACPYDHIIDMMRGLDLQDDGILMNQKIRSIETDFCRIVRDEDMLCDSMEYINDKALADGETSLKFALLFSSRNFDALAMKETKVRSAMLKILETNFINADAYRLQDKERLYNSITLLGEYYYRVRLADNTPITILGESLLTLLIREVSSLDVVVTVRLAKLILTQITLNGDILRVMHKADLRQLLFHLRRNLIEQPALTKSVKAFLLMTLDLYYSNFANLGVQLEDMYTQYLMQQQDEDEGNNNNLHSQQLQHQQQQQQQQQHIQKSQVLYQAPQTAQQQQQQQQQQQLLQSYTHTDVNETQNSSYENGSSDIVANESFEVPPSTKKWSEQVCEDSFYESELSGGCDGDIQSTTEERLSNNTIEHNNDQANNSRQSYSRNSPRSAKNSPNTKDSDVLKQPQVQQSVGEERDQSKPLPRWRATRFNRDGDQHDRIRNNQHRRLSGSYDEDHESVRSEGGSIRLYSINDRLKHSQEKIERSVCIGHNYNSIANSNWDRQSQRDDRSERSYNSNYERGGNNNNRRGSGGRHFNNHHRQNYDKPPRFQKNHQNQHQHQQNKDNNKIHSETWRRSNANITNTSSNAVDDNKTSDAFNTNGPETNSRSSSRARTLPRPAKSNLDDTNSAASYRGGVQNLAHNNHSHHQRGSHIRGGGGGGARSYNGRYSSQSSLASEASSTLDRRHNQRNRNFGRRSHQQSQAGDNKQHQQQQQDWEDTHSVHGQPEDATNWNTNTCDNTNSELVRNARQTTKYMNYLSSQK